MVLNGFLVVRLEGVGERGLIEPQLLGRLFLERTDLAPPRSLGLNLVAKLVERSAHATVSQRGGARTR
jgi:hypothetical protein